MNKEFLDEMKLKLETRKDELKARLEKIHQSKKREIIEVLDPNSTERAVQTQNDEVIDGLDTMETKELNDVLHALNKIEKNQYGICEETGEEISLNRLRAVPHARFAILEE